ncbi:MAG: hypothetical protein ACLGIA_13595, partial [Actinomycetes bacterium]
MGTQQERPGAPSCRRALALLAVGVAALALGAWLYIPHASPGLVLDPGLAPDGGRWPPTGAPALRAALWWDYALVVGYGTCLGLLTDLGRRLFYAERARRIATAALECTLLAVVMDVVENTAALAALSQQSPRLLPFVAAASVVKWCALVVAAPVALASALVVLRRAQLHARRRYGPDIPQQRIECVPPSPVGSGPEDGQSRSERWARGYLVPDVEPSPAADGNGDGGGWPRDVKGFCVSGGGVRS